MSHQHNHGNSNLKTAFLLNLTFTIFEIIGGLLTNSVSILSDAVHDLGDTISLFFSLMMERVSRKKGNSDLTFGYARYSLLGAVFSAFILTAGSVWVLYNALSRIFTVEEVHAEGMLYMAIAGIVFNGIAVLRVKKDESVNSKVVFLHLLEDALGWVAVFIISIVMIFVDLPILDPILSMVIALFVLSRILPTFKKIGKVFMQYRPEGIEVEDIMKRSLEVDGISEVHDIHIWSLDGLKHIASLHAVIKKGRCDVQKIVKELKKVLSEAGISHITIETEAEGESCIPCSFMA